ncbi:MAG: homoserine dehydrogenase, partial [Methanosarcinales archaeon]
MKKIRISIIGFGAVGQGVAKVIKEKREYLKNKNNLDLSVVAISDSKGSYVDEEGIDLKYALDRKKEIGTVASTKYSGLEVIKKIDHEIVVEVTPTNIDNGEPGLTHMLTAFENYRHVVTSNKGPLALYYKELCNCANKNKVEFRYEATVGGAMPIINLAKEVLAGNEILSIDGI